MKYILSILAAGLLSTTADAQNGFYLTGGVGAGTTNVKQNYSYIDGSGNAITRSSLINYNAGIGVGYHYKNWRFQTGLQYLKTGYELNNLAFGSDFDPLLQVPPGTGSYRISYNHIGIPLQVGYTLAPARKLSLVPMLGVLASYNLGAGSRISATGLETNTTWSKAMFDNRYNRISLWGTAKLQLEYKLTDRISITGGPSIQYMISNFAKDYSPVPENKSSQRNYSINIDLGVVIKL